LNSITRSARVEAAEGVRLSLLGRSRKRRSPRGLRHPLLEHYYLRTKAVRAATASERPSVGLRSRAWQRACAYPSMASRPVRVPD